MKQIFSLMLGLNLILIGAVALLASVVGVVRRKKELTSPFTIVTFGGGLALLILGIRLAF
ncbi:MAG: hypothetical protein IH614_07410 [Desulfuromonadales bacterium]|nr:hypothetical protein [Desulfuromonadales bacterium]